MKTEKNVSEKVVVKYNGPSGWDIDYPGRGKVAIGPGEETHFDPHDPAQLHVLLGIIKEVNRSRTNERVALKATGGDGFKEQVKIPKFEIVDGKEFLPDVLRKHKYSASNMLTDEEEKAIRDLCPSYFDQKRDKFRG